jgi:proline racemase
MAALHAAGKLAEATPYRQESVTGSVFTGTVASTENGVIPTITGRAHVTAEATLIFDSEDPIRWGLTT